MDSRDRARGLVEARIAARARRRADLGARVTVMRDGVLWRRSVRCGRETRRRATRCGRGLAIVDCAGVNGSRILNTKWGVLAVVRPWVGACARFERWDENFSGVWALGAGVGRGRRRGLRELRASVALNAVAPTRELLTFCAY